MQFSSNVTLSGKHFLAFRKFAHTADELSLLVWVIIYLLIEVDVVLDVCVYTLPCLVSPTIRHGRVSIIMGVCKYVI